MDFNNVGTVYGSRLISSLKIVMVTYKLVSIYVTIENILWIGIQFLDSICYSWSVSLKQPLIWILGSVTLGENLSSITVLNS